MIKMLKKLLPKKLYVFGKNVKKNVAENCNAFKSRKDIIKNVNIIKEKIKMHKTINVLIIAQFPEMWNSEKSLYESLSSNKLFSVSVLAVPKRNNSDNDKLFQFNPMYDYCLEHGINVTNAMQNGSFVTLSEDIDYIFVQRPYDGNMPECYCLSRLSKIGLVCYIPYSGRMTKGQHLKEIEFNSNILCYYYAIFADCDDAYSFILNWNRKHLFTNVKKVYNIGYPRFDLLMDLKSEESLSKKKTTFLWLARWSMDNYHGYSHFLKYIDDMITYFSKHSELKLIIRPHPLMFSNFIKIGVMTPDDITKLKEKIEMTGNISFDENADYLETFKESDFLISDGTSLLLEYFFTAKPVIYCSNYESYKDSLESNNNLTTQARKIMSTFYFASSIEELLDHIEKLYVGLDEKKEQRDNLINRSFKNDGNVACRIVNILSSDL